MGGFIIKQAVFFPALQAIMVHLDSALLFQMATLIRIQYLAFSTPVLCTRHLQIGTVLNSTKGGVV